MAQVRKYYEEQLRVLREQSQVFVARYPKLAPFLAEAAHDPDIERLLEGFAFISGKLWHKIEDAYPEVSEQLLEFVAPNYLKPLPSASILEFLPKLSQAGTRKVIERGTLIETRKEQKRYFFSTCYATQVLPLSLQNVSASREHEFLKLQLDFELMGAATLQDLPEVLRLHFCGDLKQAYWWYYLFLNQIQDAALLVDERIVALRDLKYRPVGFGAQESLLPFGAENFQVTQHLLEYYSFPEKFMFVDLSPMPWRVAPYAQKFSLQFSLKVPQRLNLTGDVSTFKINCCPVLNIAERQAVPMVHLHEQSRYLLQVAEPEFSAAVHSVLGVDAWSDVAREHYRYLPAYAGSDLVKHRYQVHVSEGVASEVPDVYLELLEDELHDLEKIVVAARVLAYQPLAFLELQRGDIVDDGQSLLGCGYRNVSGLSLPVYPPLGRSLSWRLLCYLALQFKNLDQLLQIQSLLLQHDFAAAHGDRYQGSGQRLVDSLESLQHEKVLKFHRGEALRGFKSLLSLRESAFLNVGEIFLFGSVLVRIFQDRAPMNSFHDLEVKCVSSGESLRFT